MVTTQRKGSAPAGSNILAVHLIAYGHWPKAIYEDCKKELDRTGNQMKNNADTTGAVSPRYNKGKVLILNEQNIKTRRPSQNLDRKLYEPFEILELILPTAI
jgi:hypothetical protein